MNKSTKTFQQFFSEMTTIDVVGGSSTGFSPSSPNSSDSYAPGDTRLAVSYGTYSRKGKVKQSKRNKRRKSRKSTKRSK
jgi:hypothetical protein